MFAVGSWRWHTYANPDPGGYFGALFLFSVSVLLAATALDAFSMASYAGWYRTASTWGERAEVERRWAGLMLALAGFPFLVFGLLFLEQVGNLLTAGAFLASGGGAWLFVSAGAGSRAADR